MRCLLDGYKCFDGCELLAKRRGAGRVQGSTICSNWMGICSRWVSELRAKIFVTNYLCPNRVNLLELKMKNNILRSFREGSFGQSYHAPPSMRYYSNKWLLICPIDDFSTANIQILYALKYALCIANKSSLYLKDGFG